MSPSSAARANLASPKPVMSSSGATSSASRSVITKLVLEGSVKHRADNAVIRLFAKVTIPEFPPTTFSLFPEGSTRLLSSVCHPLTPEGAPYALPNETRLLTRAVRALDLPTPVPESYLDVLNLSPEESTRTTNGGQNLTKAMTGEVIVQNFEYSYLSPSKIVPPSKLLDSDPSDGTLRVRRRRSSIGASLRDGPLAYHIIAMELSVPLVSFPPRGPYMINMEIPRCLHNTLKLQLFAPPLSRASRSVTSEFTAASSAVSSVEEERWEVRAIPALLAPARRRRGSEASSESWAEDDHSSSSDSSGSSLERHTSRSTGSHRSLGSRGGEVVRGSFPSTDRIIIRWAQANAAVALLARSRLDSGMDGRKRVSVDEVKSRLYCKIGKPLLSEGTPPAIPVEVLFEAKCMGLSHPGVETALGLDLVLDMFGSGAVWAEDKEDNQHFEFSGDRTARSWSWVQTRSTPPESSRWPSTPEDRITSASNIPSASPHSRYSLSRSLSSLSASSSQNEHAASLLNAPLPGSQSASMHEYSFDISPIIRTVSSAKGTPRDDDSMDDYFPSTPRTMSSRRSSMNSLHSAYASPNNGTHFPSDPLIIHIDLLPILPTAPHLPNDRVQASFALKTTLLLTPSLSDSEVVALPTFRIPSASKHTCSINISAAERGSEHMISAPEDGTADGQRSKVRVGYGNDAVNWDVDISGRPWSESVSSAGNVDAWGDDCLLLALPRPRTQAREVQTPARQSTLGTKTTPYQESPYFLNTSSDATPGPSWRRPPLSQTVSDESPTRRLSTSVAVGQGNLNDVENTLTLAADGSPVRIRSRPTGVPTPFETPVRQALPVAFPQTPVQESPIRERPLNDASLSLPWVEVSVSPILPNEPLDEWSHVIRVRAPWPHSLSAPDRLPRSSEFGLLSIHPSHSSAKQVARVLSATVDGRQANFEIFPGVPKAEREWATTGLGAAENTAIGGVNLDWNAWVRITLPSGQTGGTMEIVYTVDGVMDSGKGYRSKAFLTTVLPCFSVSVTRMIVEVDDIDDHSVLVSPKDSNLRRAKKNIQRFIRYELKPYFTPTLSLSIHPPPSRLSTFLKRTTSTIPYFAILMLFLWTWLRIARLDEQITDALSKMSSHPEFETPIPSSTPPFSVYETPAPSPVIPSSATQEEEEIPSSTFGGYIPSATFDDDMFDELPNMAHIPVTTSTFSTSLPTLTPTPLPTTIPHANHDLIPDRLRHPLLQLYHQLYNYVPVQRAQRLWSLLVMMFHYPLAP